MSKSHGQIVDLSDTFCSILYTVCSIQFQSRIIFELLNSIIAVNEFYN